MTNSVFNFIAANNAAYTSAYSIGGDWTVTVGAGAIVNSEPGSNSTLAFTNGTTIILDVLGTVNAGDGGNAAIRFNATTTGSIVTVDEEGVIHGGEKGLLALGGMTLTNGGSINGYSGIELNTADDVTIINSGYITGDYAGIVASGSGKRTVSNYGTIGDPFLGFGNAYVDDGTGGDTTITNYGTMLGAIYTGTGDDVVVNLGTMQGGGFSFGDGNDTFDSSAGSVQDYAYFDMGAGDDTLILGSGNFTVVDGAGNDNYTMGEGSDVFSASSDGASIGIDHVNAGDNPDVNFGAGGIGDLYFASAIESSLFINLSGRDFGTILAGQAISDETGLDYITGFESITSGSGDDVLVGNYLGNRLEGGAGNDLIHGRAGDDFLAGGSGNDTLIGGKGADLLFGGADADTFQFLRAGQSTVAEEGRDRIADFANGIDVIDFAFLDDDARLRAINGTFSGKGRDEILITSNEDGWLVSVDANGDGTADAAVQVDDRDHLILWDGSDFGLL